MAGTHTQEDAADTASTSLYGDYKDDEKEAAYDERNSDCYRDVSRDKWEGVYEYLYITTLLT